MSRLIQQFKNEECLHVNKQSEYSFVYCKDCTTVLYCEHPDIEIKHSPALDPQTSSPSVTGYKCRICKSMLTMEQVQHAIKQARLKSLIHDSQKPKKETNMPKEGQLTTNEQGGSQSFIEADFNCIPWVVLRLLAQCLGFGKRKYGFENWKKIPIEEHLAHAMNHINEWRAGDRSEPHLVNAMARITFALWQAVDSGQQPTRYIHPDMLKETK